jgi:hypothetical protein
MIRILILLVLMIGFSCKKQSCKERISIVSQTGTDNPSETVLKTDFYSVNWSRNANGVYQLDLKISPNNTELVIEQPSNSAHRISGHKTDEFIQIYTTNLSNEYIDDVLINSRITIRECVH